MTAVNINSIPTIMFLNERTYLFYLAVRDNPLKCTLSFPMWSFDFADATEGGKDSV